MLAAMLGAAALRGASVCAAGDRWPGAGCAGRRFALEGHPRLEAIARAGDVVRFPADSDLPDPYDGLIPGQESLKVHACVGLPLFAGQTLIGALTLDGMDADRFDSFSDEELRLIAALAGALNNALLIARLEIKTCCRQASEYRSRPPGDDRPVGADAQLKKEIEIVAASDLNVLISGETGTGKELVAKAVHQGRRGRPIRWSISTARRCRKAWRKASCLVT
jgi:anaerobic nitric oxide reductase transcription regulator